MKIDIESKSGFCFGVENAISTAEKALKTGARIYSLGPIVHNDLEVKRLEKLGLETITHEEMKSLHDCKLLIRAHGEPPETYEIARKNNIVIIEATCPIVKQLQKRIKAAYASSEESGEQIVLFGKKGHAEIRGLIGQTNTNAILISATGDISKIDFSKPSIIYSQTTRSRDQYSEVVDLIRDKYREAGLDPDTMLMVNNTICGQVANREPSLREFAAKHDIIIFVSGKESSNGKMLYSVCKSVNENSYFISDVGEIMEEWFTDKESVGVCGATSTPRWLISEVSEKIKLIDLKNY
ncbi:MAG TPA: 4-hydroxy-3-methylbut-2-enyl diphosphate reductase [Bacteroidales bacterium]|nr:4-hydroxy-3-methylbut-2-enyl diphosphate reductase [Bacteroidales bacterium]